MEYNGNAIYDYISANNYLTIFIWLEINGY